MAMYNELELALSHNGVSWCTDGFYTKFYGRNLETIEGQISAAILNDPRFHDNESVKVKLRFDIDVLPKWLHQYQAHYFNYTFTVNKQEPE